MSNIKFYAGKVGSKAHTLSKVWKLGFHVFDCLENKVFRLCYLRTKKYTYYLDVSIKVRRICCVQGQPC